MIKHATARNEPLNTSVGVINVDADGVVTDATPEQEKKLMELFKGTGQFLNCDTYPAEGKHEKKEEVGHAKEVGHTKTEETKHTKTEDAKHSKKEEHKK